MRICDVPNCGEEASEFALRHSFEGFKADLCQTHKMEALSRVTALERELEGMLADGGEEDADA